MVTFIRKATKQSLLTMLRKADKITPRLLARLFEGVLFKDEYETFSAAGGLDHGDMSGLTDDDHTQYVRHNLSTAADDFLVGSGSDTFVKKTATEAEAILGGPFLPLTAGVSHPLTGNLQVETVAAAQVNLDAGGTGFDYSVFSDAGTKFLLKKVSSADAAIIEVSPDPDDGTSDATVQSFYSTITSGDRKSIIYDGTVGHNIQHEFNAGTGDVDLCQQAGDVTIGGAALDYTFTSSIDTDTDVTGAELEELTDASTTDLHKHGMYDATGGAICLSEYIDIKARNAEYHLHGMLMSLDTAHDLGEGDLVVTGGISKIILVVNAGTDVVGDITVTGTAVDRDTGVETAATTDTITIDAVTTDDSDTDAESNVRHALTGAYITQHWFKGEVTISSADTDVTDMDTYQVAFEQFNDSPNIVLESFDISAHASNALAWMYAYLYTLEVTGDKCDVTRVSSLELPVADVNANQHYRLRRGQLAIGIDGTTDGIWIDMIPGPLASVYWHDMNIKLWANTGGGSTTIGTSSYGISGTVTGSPPMSGVLVTLSGDASDTDTTGADGAFSFTGLAAGSYVVTPTRAGYTFAPVSTAVVITNYDQVGKNFVGTLGDFPIVENFEADTIGDNEATLEAKATHDAIDGTSAACRAIDYLGLVPIRDNRFAQCLYADVGPGDGSSSIHVGAGKGFTPSGNGTVRVEGIAFAVGIGSRISLYSVDTGYLSGIRCEMDPVNFTIYTRANGFGSEVQKGQHAHGLTNGLGLQWTAFMFEYDFSDDSYQMRAIELGLLGTNQEDSGWIGGTAASPTFGAATEQIRFTTLTGCTNSHDHGIAQTWVDDGSNDWNLGEDQVANYTVP